MSLKETINYYLFIKIGNLKNFNWMEIRAFKDRHYR